MLIKINCCFHVFRLRCSSLLTWKDSFEKINTELEVNTRKKQALENLHSSGRISQFAYECLNKELTDDIEQIEVSVSRGAFTTVMTNQHPSVHMQTILSLAAVHGEITFAHIHDPRYREDARVKTFKERARIFLVPRPGPATRCSAPWSFTTMSSTVLKPTLITPTSSNSASARSA